jgi:hypothetical protein
MSDGAVTAVKVAGLKVCAGYHLHYAKLFDVTGQRLVAMAGRLVHEVGLRRCCLKDCWECCSSLEHARWGVLFSETR